MRTTATIIAPISVLTTTTPPVSGVPPTSTATIAGSRAFCQLWRPSGKLDRKQQAGDGREHAGKGEGEDLVLIHLETRSDRSQFTRADSFKRPADRRPVLHEPGGKQQNQCDDQFVGEAGRLPDHPSERLVA